MATAAAPLPERMTWFWHGHFATSYRGVGSAPLLLQQNQTQRRLALGNFGDLARAMAVDPAMLVWLNGNSNRKGKPNENLAREFMELFTLGVGGYAEDDVREAARALTGWRVQFASGTAVRVDRDHDAGPETILGSTMAFDADSLSRFLVARPAPAEFIALRMWRRFVGENPPDGGTLSMLVKAYGPDRDIAGLVRAVVRAHPSVSVYRMELGKALVRAGEIPAGREQIDEAVNANPLSARVQAEAGRIFLSANRARVAARYYERAAKLEPETPVYDLVLGEVYPRLSVKGEGDYFGQAETRLRQVLNEKDAGKPQRLRAFLSLGKLYEERGLKEQARQAYREALEVNPNSTPARKGLASLNR
jgi:tetratricopeptide (TPR) repeat protein